MACTISGHCVLSAIYWTALASPSEEAGHPSFYVKLQNGEVKRVDEAKAKIAISLSAALRAFKSKLRIERKKKGGGGRNSSNLND